VWLPRHSERDESTEPDKRKESKNKNKNKIKKTGPVTRETSASRLASEPGREMNVPRLHGYCFLAWRLA
jgi:hypothetical protein